MSLSRQPRDGPESWPLSLLHTLRQRAFGRFAAVSIGSVVVGHALLFFLHSVAHVEPVSANLISTLINSVLVFLANRRWVWSVDGIISVRAEVVPFLLLVAAGLIVSTVLVWATTNAVGEGLWVNAANLAGFGLVWLARFFVFDRIVYR